MFLTWIVFPVAMTCFRQQTVCSSIWPSRFPPEDSPFNLISSYPLEPDRQPFSGLLAFAQAVLTARVHSSHCSTDAHCTREIYEGQGAECPSVWNARPRETVVKEAAIKLDAHPLTHTLDKSCCPQTPSSGIQSHEYMSAVFHCYLNVVPLKNF